MANRGRATVVMVAERAGVSIASVSRVLNGLATSDDVRDNVLRAAAELDYVPDAVARSLKVGRTDQIALAVADVGNPVYVSMIHAITDVLGTAGLRLVISSDGADPADQLGILGNLSRGYCDGLILSPLRVTNELLDALTTIRQPIVVIGSLPPHLAHRQRAHRLGGRRRAGPRPSGRPWSPPRRLRQRPDRHRARFGALARLRRAQRPARARRRRPTCRSSRADFTYAAAVPAVEALLAQATPDAIMCANDLLAVAAINVLRRRGRSVPDDVAVVGMDDTDIAELDQPDAHERRPRRRPPRRDRRRTAPRPPRRRRRAPARRITVAPALTLRESA